MLGTGGPGLEVWKGVFMLASAFAFGRVMNPTDEGQNYTPPTPPLPFLFGGWEFPGDQRLDREGTCSASADLSPACTSDGHGP